jgi:hypothetical protein
MAKKRFPSQIRYDEENPIISIRVTKEAKAKLQMMERKSGKSLSQITSELLLTNAVKFEKAYARRFTEGYEKGCNEMRIWYFCSICNKVIYMRPNSNDHQAMIGYMKEKGWVHGECHNKNKQ